MHLAWLLVLFVPVYKQLVHTQNKTIIIMLPVINQRVLNRLIIVPALIYCKRSRFANRPEVNRSLYIARHATRWRRLLRPEMNCH